MATAKKATTKGKTKGVKKTTAKRTATKRNVPTKSDSNYGSGSNYND